jgi:hypothetical protein
MRILLCFWRVTGGPRGRFLAQLTVLAAAPVDPGDDAPGIAPRLQATQVRMPGKAWRRALGIGSSQWVALGPRGVSARARCTASFTVSSI